MKRVILGAVVVLVSGAPATADTLDRAMAVPTTLAGEHVLTPEDLAAEKRREWRETQDLDAQRDMANFAERQFWVSVAGAVFAALSVAFTITALWQTNRSLRMTQHTARAELRPYLGLAKFDMGNFTQEPKPTFHWTIRNFGSTAAMAVTIRMALKLIDGTPDRHVFMKDDFHTFGTQDVLPGGDSGVSAKWPDPLDDAIRTEILNGQKSFAFAVEVSFSDAFGDRHTMRHAEVRWGRPNLQPNHFLPWEEVEG